MSQWNTIRGVLGNLTGKAIRANSLGDLGVEIGGNNLSAFGDIITTELEPITQYSFLLQSTPNSQIMTHTTSGTGAVATVDNGRLSLTSGTTAGGYAHHQSVKIAAYRGGQGNLARFTAVFPGSAANSIQIAGVGNQATANNAPPVDGYFFGYVGTTFGILHRNAFYTGGPANAVTDTFIAKTAWNVDVMDGSGSAANPSGMNLNPALGNVYQIKWPFLGYGAIVFAVLDPDAGKWRIVHIIKYPNSTTTLQLSHPGMNFVAETRNTYANLNSTTSLTMYVGSVGLFLTGKRVFNGPMYGADSGAAKNATTTESPFLSIACANSVNEANSRGLIRLRQINLVTSVTNQMIRFNIRRNQTLTNPTWVAVNGTIGSAPTTLTAAQSIAFVDSSATTFTPSPPTKAPGSPGTSDVIFNAVLGPTGFSTIDLTPYDIFILPGEWITISAVATANSSTMVGANWQEDW